jgi:hypothetical protein
MPAFAGVYLLIGIFIVEVKLPNMVKAYRFKDPIHFVGWFMLCALWPYVLFCVTDDPPKK